MIMAESSDQSHSNMRCSSHFKNWMELQEEGKKELLQAINSHDPKNADSEAELKKQIEKSISQFEDYVNQRSELAKNDVSGFLVPAWCTSWENSLLWISGCRPSMFIRLVYTVTGLDLESKLNEFLQGTKSLYEVSDLSPQQVELLNALQMKTIREEEKLTSRLASLQEEIADPGVVMMTDKLMVEEEDDELEKMMKKHEENKFKVMEEADKLRMRTLKDVAEILSPLQVVMFLAYSKKLQLCVHRWGKLFDQKHGRG